VIEWGGTDPVTDVNTVGIPAAQGEQLLIAGRSLAGGLEVRVYSDPTSASARAINIGGHVNRMNPDA